MFRLVVVLRFVVVWLFLCQVSFVSGQENAQKAFEVGWLRLDGTVGVSSAWRITGLCPTDEGTEYEFDGQGFRTAALVVAWYDSSLGFIGGSTQADDEVVRYVAPPNAFFVRFAGTEASDPSVMQFVGVEDNEERDFVVIDMVGDNVEPDEFVTVFEQPTGPGGDVGDNVEPDEFVTVFEEPAGPGGDLVNQIGDLPTGPITGGVDGSSSTGGDVSVGEIEEQLESGEGGGSLFDIFCRVLAWFLESLTGWLVELVEGVWRAFWDTVYTVVLVFLLGALELISLLCGSIPDGWHETLGGVAEVSSGLMAVARVYLPLDVIGAVLTTVVGFLYAVWSLRLVIKLIPTIG